MEAVVGREGGRARISGFGGGRDPGRLPILCIHLGTPPKRFDWQWTDKDKKFCRDGVLTPQEFTATYVDLPVSEYVCLVNDPRPSSPIGRTFTVEYLGNVIGGPRSSIATPASRSSKTSPRPPSGAASRSGRLRCR